jgi:phage repressor protein C with HTH and peptisase S24 domain
MAGIDKLRRWMKAERERRGWSGAELARRAKAIAAEQGVTLGLTQQSISQFEKSDGAKREPLWLGYVRSAFEASADESQEDAHFDTNVDDPVMIERLPTFAGAGGGGTGEGDRQLRAFSSSLVRELGVEPGDLLMIEIEGDSLAPEYLSGDQMLVDKRRTSLAQPGAFCLWDGDGYVVKYLEKVAGSEPPKVRVISGNPRYSTFERLVEEVKLMGRIVWFGRFV